MDAQKFLDEFGHIANAPGGIEKLKSLVLQLAVQGKLINEQAPRRHSILGELGKWGSGGTPPKSHPEYYGGSIPWLVIGDLNDGVVTSTSDSITQAGLDNSAAKLIPVGALLIGMYGSIGKLGITGIACATNQAIAHCVVDETLVLTRYLFTFIRANRDHLFAQGKGLAQQNISQTILKAQPIELPSLEEQSRTVAKVDELMALCDKLEAQQQARSTLQNTLRQSTLQALSNATTPQELQSAWTRLSDNFDRLFHSPEDVIALKGMILDLAMSGELVKMGRTADETGSDLLKTIASKRVAWSLEAQGQEKKEALGMIKKLSGHQTRHPDDALPTHWSWGSLLQISQAVVDCHNKTAPYTNDGIHIIRTSDIRNGKMDLSRTKKISEETYAFWSRRMPPKEGDIFFTREAPMGESAIVPRGSRVCLGQRIMLIRLFSDLFSNRFLLYAIQSPSFQKRMTKAAVGMTVKHLRVGDVENLVVPVPPKTEQDQIVSRVDALFNICDLYANQLSNKHRTSTNLAHGVTSSFSGSISD